MPVQYVAAHLDQRRSPVKLEEQGLQNIEQIWGTQQEIIRLYVLGMKEVDIATSLNLTPATISNVVNSNIGRRRILELQGGRDAETVLISDKLKSLREHAVTKLAEIMDCGDPKLVLRAAESVLDRTGHGRAEVKAQDQSHMSDSHIQHLHRIAAQQGWQQEAIDLVPVDAAEELA